MLVSETIVSLRSACGIGFLAAARNRAITVKSLCSFLRHVKTTFDPWRTI